MFRHKLRYSFFAVFSVTVFAISFAQQKSQTTDRAAVDRAAVDREAAWEAVDAANVEGLPKTAIEKLSAIIESALADKAYDEAIKAIGLKIVLDGNRAEELMMQMQQAIDESPVEMKPVMEAILANWYWHYLIQNRSRIVRRTQTSLPSDDEITTWSLPQILAQVDKQFDKAFAHSDALKATSVESFSKLLVGVDTDDQRHPTMFDVIAHNAISFYAAGEQAGSMVQDSFELSAVGPVFAPREEFIAWQPVTIDEDSHLLRAVQLYQELLRFHLNDRDESALLDADLLRLNFANEVSVGETKTARYKAALRSFANTHSDHQISVLALHRLADVFRFDGELVEAHKIATEGRDRFTDGNGAGLCAGLIKEIESHHETVAVERVWADPWPTLNIRYRNTPKIDFRLVHYDFDSFITKGIRNFFDLSNDEQQMILNQRPVKSWSVVLPKTDDFKERVERVEVPKDVPQGSYFLVASTVSVRRVFAVHEVWVSNLAMVTRSKQPGSIVEGFVIDSKSGEPIVGAEVRAWQRRQPVDPVRTDKSGMFRFPSTERERMYLLASHQGDRLSSHSAISGYVYQGQEAAVYRTQFFTDRSIYRPGQTVHYKGICTSCNRSVDDYKTFENQNVTVVFSDSKGNEIERRQHLSNAYGSFSGTVTVPYDRLMGKMWLRVEGGPDGDTKINVEEYKRPKFRVELASPKDEAKLGQAVTVTGKATAYSGVAINDANVSWRVFRGVSVPIWWSWRCWWIPQKYFESQEIAHGTTTTNKDGSFDLTFVARPDATVSRESEPTFEYRIYADVTDTTGETRSDNRTVRLGYTALAASMTAGDWLISEEAIEIKINTTTLDGEGSPAKGTLQVYSLKQPNRVVRKEFQRDYDPYDPELDAALADEKPVNPSDPNSWPLDEEIVSQPFETNGAGQVTINVKLKAGIYRAKLETRDAFGNEVSAILPLQVFDPKANQPNINLADLFVVKKTVVEPGETFEAIWGSGYDTARAYIEVAHRGNLLQSFWTQPNQTQSVIRQEVTEAMRGGFYVRVTMVRENRVHTHSQFIDVPWTNKNLSIKWERFISKLTPGQKVTWTAIVSGPDAERASAEMIATLYDASLDAFVNHSFGKPLDYLFRRDDSELDSQFTNILQYKSLLGTYRWQPDYKYHYYYDLGFPASLTNHLEWYGYPRNASGIAMEAEAGMGGMGGGMGSFGDTELLAADTLGGKQVDLANVTARKNLNETAFFFPHLVAGDDGSVRIEFTMPEALTQWKFIGFAHDAKLRAGMITDTVVTSKDLMVQPNPPRFLREGDVIEFTVKVSNRSATRQTGMVRLNLNDARTNESVDAKLGNSDTDKAFEVAAGESKSFSWRLSVPDGIGFLTYKAIGSTGRISDGEEGFLPVLSRRVLVTESLPLPIRGQQTKEFEFKKLAASGDSKTLKHQSLTVQMVSNPSWYAVMALPYLMEFPHDCSEQVFSKFYANSLGHHIVTSNPKIERVFAQWRNTPALDSPLEKNADLQTLMLEETPWYRHAQNESQARRNVGILFDQNRLEAETKRALNKLAEMQHNDGWWSWFPGGRGNEFITLHITTGFGRLRHLGVNIDASPAIRSLERLDAWATLKYNQILQKHPDRNNLSTEIALYLYGRSFFLEDQAIADVNRVAVDYWLSQAKQHWLKLDCRQSEAHLALALKRFGDLKSAQAIMDSIKERSVSNEEMGMFWRDQKNAWWWYGAPIETQAMMIEAFDEVMDDAQAVENCKVWLLKQKQTQNWKTTKATSDAIYALLLRGTDGLSSDRLVEVTLAGDVLEPHDVEAGTGFVEHRFGPGEIKPQQSQIKLTNVGEGVAWGSMHWQYLEDINKITPHEGTPLKLTKELYVMKNTNKGPTLEKVSEAVAVGDELVVRVVVRVDRDMEYVHLKDHRGSGTEPVNVLSQYKYQDGLGYYESTRDTASHFFIDYLPEGTYVFEYSTRVQLRGEYQTGIANIECMYAPEFNSHSESLPIVVK